MFEIKNKVQLTLTLSDGAQRLLAGRPRYKDGRFYPEGLGSWSSCGDIKGYYLDWGDYRCDLGDTLYPLQTVLTSAVIFIIITENSCQSLVAV